MHWKSISSRYVYSKTLTQTFRDRALALGAPVYSITKGQDFVIMADYQIRQDGNSQVSICLCN